MLAFSLIYILKKYIKDLVGGRKVSLTEFTESQQFRALGVMGPALKRPGLIWRSNACIASPSLSKETATVSPKPKSCFSSHCYSRNRQKSFVLKRLEAFFKTD